MRTVGAVVRGIRTPIIRENDDLVAIVRDSVLAAAEAEGEAEEAEDVHPGENPDVGEKGGREDPAARGGRGGVFGSGASADEREGHGREV